MGKTKWYNEFNGGKPGSKKQDTSGRTEKALIPGTAYRWSNPEDIPLPVLIHQLFIRLRRTWVALRYQADRLTLGMLKRHTVLKLSTIALAAYLLTGSRSDPFVSSAGTVAYTEEKSLFSGPEAVSARDFLEAPPAAEPADRPTRPKKEAKPSGKPERKPPSGLALEEADAHTREYIERFRHVAIGEMEKFGIPASISMAQGLIESQAGRSKLARNNNNHFGMKCFLKRCGRGHCSNHTDDTHKDFFRIYRTAWESWRAHSIMISSGRYAHLKKYGRDYRQWAYGLKKAGYATDPGYAEKLIRVIERYRLDRLDR